jgi:hypothetical protein
MDRQHNGQTKKKNDIQNVTHTTKDIETQTPLKPEMNTGAPER